MKRKLKPAQERFWNRLTGNHNRRVREQIEYMRKSGTVTAAESDYLIEQSYTASESEIWRLIIDHIRSATMQDFRMTFHKRPKKLTKRAPKKR